MPCAHGGPGALGQAVGGLPAGRGADDLGLLAVDPASGLTPQELLVTVTAELIGESPSVGAELLEGLNDAHQHE